MTKSFIPDIKDIVLSWVDRLSTIDDRFINLPLPDPDMIIYRHNWVKAIAANIRDKAQLDNWVRVSNCCNIPLGIDWLDMDELWLTAISTAVDEFVKEQNKASSEHMQQMQSKIEALKPYQSPMESIPKPHFF
jgi:hypothetical protein